MPGGHVGSSPAPYLPLGIHPAQVLHDLPGVRVTTGHVPLPSTPISASLRRGDIWQTQKKSPTLGALPCRPCSSSLALEISLKMMSKIKHKPPKPKFYTQHLLFPEDPSSRCGIVPQLSLSKNPILHIKTLMQFVPGFAEVPPHPHGRSGDQPASARLGSRGGTGPHGGFPVGAVSLSASNFLFFHEFFGLPRLSPHHRFVCQCKPRRCRTHLHTSGLALPAAQAWDNPAGCF